MMTLAMAIMIAPTMTTCTEVTILTNTSRRVLAIDFFITIATVSKMLKSSSGVRKNTVTELNEGRPGGSKIPLVVLVKLLFIASVIPLEVQARRAVSRKGVCL